MATTTIPWGDGSGDNIYLTYSASQGDQTVLVSSDANGGAARTKNITFVSTVGNISRILTVSQEEGASLVSITWNNVCITYDDTAIGYPDTSPQYVQDGLVFLLDGINKGEGANTWVEKINGYVFENHGAVFNPDHVYLDGASYLENTTATTPLVADGTIEVVYQRESASGTVLVPTRPSAASYCGFGVVNNAIRWSVFSSSSRYTIPNAPALASVSLSADRSLGNGYALTQRGNSYLNQSNGNPSRVGVLNSNANFFTGKIYCIRVYNRKLTEAEVLANYAIDCQRFNFDWEDYITFEDATVEQICVSTWGDGTGLTKGRAQLIQPDEVAAAFSGNTQIETFNEFRYFGLGSWTSNDSVNMFKGCTALTELTLPDVMYGRVGSNCFQNDTLLATLNLGNGRPSFYQGGTPQINYIINVKIKDIDQYIDLWRENTALSWGQLWARYESTGAHLIDASTNTEITSVTFPSGRTVVPWHCFNNMKSITSITLPSSVTEIKGYAFYNCTGLAGDIVVPSLVTSIGVNAFAYTTGITNLYILSTSTFTLTSINNITANTTAGTGNGTGVLQFNGGLSISTTESRLSFKKLIVKGDMSQANLLRISPSCNYIEQIRVGGNYTNTYASDVANGRILYSTGSRVASKLKFIEIMGTITSGHSILEESDRCIPSSGVILHLGYNGIPCAPNIVLASSTRIAKIYVGDGSSAAHDDAILAQYTADTDWSAYSSKLDTWYNYINDPNANQDYIN